MSGIPGQFDSFRRRNKEEFSSTRRGSMERGRSERRGLFSGEDYGPSLDNFRPVTLTVSSFFKQVISLYTGTCFFQPSTPWHYNDSYVCFDCIKDRL